MVRPLMLIKHPVRYAVVDMQTPRAPAKHATTVTPTYRSFDLCPVRATRGQRAALIVRSVAADPMSVAARAAAVSPSSALVPELRRAPKERASTGGAHAFNLSVLACPPRRVLAAGRAVPASAVFNAGRNNGERPPAEVARPIDHSLSHRCTTPRSLSLWRYSYFSEILSRINKLRYALALVLHPQ
jgi:hypothetical protein